MLKPRSLFTLFAAVAALVALGATALPRLNALYWVGGPMPHLLAALWLAWMFALWGALVLVMVAVGAWVNEQLAGAEATALRAGGKGAAEASNPGDGETRVEKEPLAFRAGSTAPAGMASSSHGRRAQ